MQYLGTCVDIDSEGENYGFDPTEFAQAEERALEANLSLTPEEFFSKAYAWPELRKEILLKGNDLWFSKDEDLGVMWIYSPDEDIHYIWG